MSNEIPGYNEYYKPKQWLRQSALSSASRCPRKWFYQQGCSLVPLDQFKLAFLFGEAIHNGAPYALLQDIKTATEKFKEVWQDNDNAGDEKRNLARGTAMLVNLALQNRPGLGLFKLEKPPETNIKLDRVSDYEVPFAIDLGIDVPVVGRIDGMATHRDTGEFFGLEYKTSSELATRFLLSFEMSPQLMLYNLALQTMSGKKIAGMILVGMLVSKVNPNNITHIIRIPQHQLEACIDWVKWQWAQIRSYEDRKYFPQNFGACNTYYQHGMPGYTCEYAQLCKSDDWRTMLPLYKVQEEPPFVLATESVTVEGKAQE